MGEFNLSSFLRQAVKCSERADPQDIAAEAFAEIVASGYAEAALLQALPVLVRIESNRQRIDLSAVHEGVPVGSGKIGRSRARAVADMWTQYLAGRERNAAGTWVYRAEFTHADLRAAAEYRRSLARQNDDIAEQYDALGDLMRRRKAKHLGDLPVEAVAGVIGQVAA